MSSKARAGLPQLVGGGEAREVGRRDLDRVENLLKLRELPVEVDVLDVARCAVADGRYAVADFLAGFIGVSVQIDAGVLVHARGGAFLHTVKQNAVHSAR
jgi:hypothetical protein